MMEYQSPGAAFSTGLEDFMAQREAKKRQAMLDNLAVQKAAREVDTEANRAEEHRQDLEERKAAHRSGEARWQAEADKKTAEDKAKDAAKAAQDEAGRIYADENKGTPAGQAAAYERAFPGRNPPPGTFMPPKATPLGRAIVFSPVKGTYVDTATGQPPVGGITKDDRVERSAEPKDTSAHDAAVSAKEMTRRDNAYKTAVTELDKAAAPIAAHIQGINDLGTMLNARTPEADTLIAPLVLKSTISGTGTGFRMTRAEIENVVGGRSKWESLQASLNKWSTDPKQALSITDEQRTELRDLAKAIRKGATAQMTKITKARHAMDDTDDPKQIQKIATKLQEDLTSAEEPEDPNAPPVVGGMFQGGKITKVTPIK